MALFSYAYEAREEGAGKQDHQARGRLQPDQGVCMTHRRNSIGIARFALAALLAATVGACANQNPKPEDIRLGPGGLGSARSQAKPGTSQDFSQNVGDIVYFSTDATDLSPEAQQTLTGQAPGREMIGTISRSAIDAKPECH